MTDIEKSIAEGLILIEAENEIDRLKSELIAKSVYCDSLKVQRDDMHDIATDLWLYGTAIDSNKSKMWKNAVARFEYVDRVINESKCAKNSE